MARGRLVASLLRSAARAAAQQAQGSSSSSHGLTSSGIRTLCSSSAMSPAASAMGAAGMFVLCDLRQRSCSLPSLTTTQLGAAAAAAAGRRLGASMWYMPMPLGAAGGVRHISIAALQPSDK
jgi:hypothetical protein